MHANMPCALLLRVLIISLLVTGARGVCSATTFALQAPASDSVQLDCRVHSVYTASVTRDACAVETCRANGQAFAYTSAKCSVLQCEYGYQLYPYDGSEPASVYVFSDPNPCTGQCQNGGTCLIVHQPTTNFACRCPDNYTGRLCETVRDRCVASPCVTGACHSGPDQYECRCPPGRYGQRCERDRPPYVYRISSRVIGATMSKDDRSALATRLNIFLNETFSQVDQLTNPDLLTTVIGSNYAVAVDAGYTEPVPLAVVRSAVLSAFRSSSFPYAHGDSDPAVTTHASLFECDFSAGDACGMTMDYDDSLRTTNWTQRANYVSLPTSGKDISGKTARLTSRWVSYDADACVRLRYALGGERAGRLRMSRWEVQADGTRRRRVVFSERLHGGADRWQTADVLLPRTAARWQLEVEAIAGESIDASVDIDRITVPLNSTTCRVSANECGPYTMGPHPDACLSAAWDRHCQATGGGHPRASPLYTAWFGATTLNGVANLLRRLAERAFSGDQTAIDACLGDYVRLAGGGGPSSGRVELFARGQWGTVCDDDFDDTDAAVVCRQLRFTTGESRDSAMYGPGVGRIQLARLRCSGTESTLLRCERRQGTCVHLEDAAVACHNSSASVYDVVGFAAVHRPEASHATEGALFVPNTAVTVQRAGVLVAWHVHYYTAGVRLDLLVVRRSPPGRYRVVGITSTVSRLDRVDLTLPPADVVAVQQGDTLAMYFPQGNPVAWTRTTCRAQEDSLRFSYDPVKTPRVGREYKVDTAPYAWLPCRQYSLNADIEVDTAETVPTAVANNLTAPAGSLFHCDFEHDLCGMSSAQGGQFDWTSVTGRSPTYGTGPQSAYSGRGYASCRALGHVPNQIARLESAVVPSQAGAACLSYAYHALGEAVGSLAVFARDAAAGGAGRYRLVGLHAGPAGSRWVRVEHTVSIVGDTAFQFRCITGASPLGDIAIDKISLLPGACSGGETTADEPTSNNTISEAVAPRIYHVFVNGSDVADCGSTEAPCQTMRYAMLRPGPSKELHLHGENQYNVTLDDSLGTTTRLLIAAFNPAVDSSPQVVFENSNRSVDLEYLSLRDLSVVGGVSIHSASGVFVLEMQSVVMQSDALPATSEITVSRCNELNVTIEHSTFTDVRFKFISDRTTYAVFHNSTFTASQPIGLQDGVEAGVQFDIPGRHGYHILNVSRCFFTRQHQKHKRSLPDAAFSVITRKPDTITKLFIHNSTFLENCRAVDLSLIGISEVIFSDSVFSDNLSNGSGGAVRFSPTLRSGFGTLATVGRTRITIFNCTFENNAASSSNLYNESDVYYQTRSPGSGGAVHVYLPATSTLNSGGIVRILECTFRNNSAPVRGGTVFVNPKISTEIRRTTFTNSDRARYSVSGDLIYASCNLTLDTVHIAVSPMKREVAILSYQAAEREAARLLVRNLTLVCPVGYWVQHMNASSLSGFGGIETLQLLCRACAGSRYSLDVSSVTIDGARAYLDTVTDCLKCPYGATCDRGIHNNAGFWGVSTAAREVLSMVACPPGYCEQLNRSSVAYDSCAPHRAGVLCGRCVAGRSEAMYGLECVPNADCGWHNYQVPLLMALYGVLYVLFFMFERDISRLVNVVARKLSEQLRGADARLAHGDPYESGFLQIAMYYLQTSALLRVVVEFAKNSRPGKLSRPEDVLPSVLRSGMHRLVTFDVSSFHAHVCLFRDITPYLKIAYKSTFVLALFAVVPVIYVVTGLGCFWMSPAKRPKIGPLTMHARLLLTVVSLSLYTYQILGAYALMTVNCIQVAGDSVLYHDGTISCLQAWQYPLIVAICVYVVPLFVILLLGPRLVKAKRLSVQLFFLSFVAPLFMAVPIVGLYVRLQRNKNHADDVVELTESSDASAASGASLGGVEGALVNTWCCSGRTSGEMSGVVMRAITGPYRSDLIGGICWEGAITFRRLVLILVFVFINDILLKHIAMAFVCFLVLILQIKTMPFKQFSSNVLEIVSLTLLLTIGCTNLVLSAFYNSQIVPRGSGYAVITVFEWIDVICITFLPVIGVVAYGLYTLAGRSGLKAMVADKVAAARQRRRAAAEAAEAERKVALRDQRRASSGQKRRKSRPSDAHLRESRPSNAHLRQSRPSDANGRQSRPSDAHLRQSRPSDANGRRSRPSDAHLRRPSNGQRLRRQDDQPTAHDDRRRPSKHASGRAADDLEQRDEWRHRPALRRTSHNAPSGERAQTPLHEENKSYGRSWQSLGNEVNWSRQSWDV